jgi:hypothetical protein
VPIDSVQEYSVITNNFSAEYGRASGGVVNLTTKAGTNSIHGSAWEFNRLSDYTANTYANDANGVPKGTYTRNQFGAQAGGPILKNKLFIFESTEWTRVRSAAQETEEIFDPSFIALMPTNIQNYYATYGKTTLTPLPTPAATVGTITAKCTFGSTSTTTCANPTPFPLVNGTTALPASQPVFDTVNFQAPFDAGGGTPVNQYALVGRVDFNPTGPDASTKTTSRAPTATAPIPSTIPAPLQKTRVISLTSRTPSHRTCSCPPSSATPGSTTTPLSTPRWFQLPT